LKLKLRFLGAGIGGKIFVTVHESAGCKINAAHGNLWTVANYGSKPLLMPVSFLRNRFFSV
jgi:hypothetical protein